MRPAAVPVIPSCNKRRLDNAESDVELFFMEISSR
jgi:hypothetical protein